MQLGQPWGLAALLSVPVLLLLYSLRPRRLTVHLSTTRLWREALGERQRGLGLQRLLRDLSLLLLLIAALLLSLALADPRWVTRASEPGDVVVIIDTSASMQARTPSGSRFDLAKARAKAMIETLPEGARLALMTSARQPVLRSAFEPAKDALLATLAAVEPSDEVGRPQAAVSLALALLRHRDGGRIEFITDTAFDAQLGFAGSALKLHNVVAKGAGTDSPNVAITQFDIRREVGAHARYQVLLSLRSFGAGPIQVPVTIYASEKVLWQQTVSIEKPGPHTLTLPFTGTPQGRFRVALDIDDDLAVDNHAYAVMGGAAPLRILAVGTRSPYVQSVLEALPNVVLTQRETLAETDLVRAARAHDVVVLDRIEIAALPTGNYLLINSLPGNFPWRADGQVDRPLISGSSKSPLVNGLDFSGTQIDSAPKLSIPAEQPGLQRLFWSANSDLATSYLAGGVRAVHLGFDVDASNFPLQAAFPLFIRRSVEWLSVGEDRAQSVQLRAGETFVIRAPPEQFDLIIRLPSSEGLLYELDGRPLHFDATSRAGIYRYTLGQVHHYFAVNGSDAVESDLNPRAQLPSPADARLERGNSSAAVVQSLWPYLVIAALLLLALEWTAWFGRGAGA